MLSDIMRSHVFTYIVNRVWFTSNYIKVGIFVAQQIKYYLHAVQCTLVSTKITQRKDMCK